MQLQRIILVDMPPLTSPEKPLSPACWRFLLLVACVLVFAFAVHAKVSVYHQSTQPQTPTSAKLWLNAEKTTGQPLAPSVSVLWFATLLFWVFSSRYESRFAVPVCDPVVVRARQHFLQRFLRPPPIRLALGLLTEFIGSIFVGSFGSDSMSH